MKVFPLLVLLALAAPAACAHAPGSRRDADPRTAAFDSASVVFAGHVRWVSASFGSDVGERSYGVRVTEVWKGDARDSVIVREKPGPCPLPRIALGSEYVVYAAHDSAGPYTTRCSRLVPATADELAFLRIRPRAGNE